MRLCIAEHLQPVFDAANGVIEDCQIARLLLADPLFISQRLKGRQGARPATTEIYPLSLHDALPIWMRPPATNCRTWVKNSIWRMPFLPVFRL